MKIDSADKVDVSWVLELIVKASLENEQFDPNADWRGIAVAAHACLHSLGQTCGLATCHGPDMKIFARFVDRHR